MDPRIRCTYCREARTRAAFTSLGDHVVPASLGGAWVEWRVCADCNARANEVADELVGKDFVVRFLRAFYEIPDRYGKRPSPPVFPLRLPSGGVVKATLHGNGPTFEVGLPPSVAESLALEDPGAHERLEQILADALGGRDPAVARESLALARIAQERATPPQRGRDSWRR